VEEFVLFETRRAPDRALSTLVDALESEGFATDQIPSQRFDVEARRVLDRVFVGLAAHPDGLAARVKAKSLIPGRADELVLLARRALESTLGEATALEGPA
jgi:hypothetical protein